MRRFAVARVALPLLALIAAGCPAYYYPPYPPPYYGYPGNIYLSWTFGGASCAQVPQVAQVLVAVLNDPTPIVPNTFGCQAGNPPGQLVLYYYNPGSYQVALSGLDSSGNILYYGTSTVTVNGNVSALINLSPVSTTDGGPGSALLSWNFAATVGTFTPPCTASGDADPDRMDSVALYVDGASQAAQTYQCSDGFGSAQVDSPSLSPGSHTLQLVAYQSGISYPFAQSAPVTVDVADAGLSEAFTLQWQVGGAGVSWTYPNPNACAAAVSSVSVNFSGPGGDGYAVTGDACETAVAPFKHLQAVAADGDAGVSYALDVQALGPGSALVYSGSEAAIAIQPGHFYDGTAATTVTVPLQ